MARVIHATLQDVRDELARGGIIEAPIESPKHDWHYSGYCDGPSELVVVNPSVETVKVLIHECLHRKFKRWTERRVERETSHVLSRMSNRDVADLFASYCRTRHRRKVIRVLGLAKDGSVILPGDAP
jgi:hypothetical protein